MMPHMVGRARESDYRIEDLKARSRDGRYWNHEMSLFLGSHGYTVYDDKKSGYYLDRGGRIYRLRVCGKSEKAQLTPAICGGALRVYRADSVVRELTYIDGYMLAFTADLPAVPVWELDKPYIEYLRGLEYGHTRHMTLDTHYTGTMAQLKTALSYVPILNPPVWKCRERDSIDADWDWVLQLMKDHPEWREEILMDGMVAFRKRHDDVV